MGYQTAEALVERKLRPWVKSGVITSKQFKDLVAYCVEHGFWEALGRATKIKYSNIRSRRGDPVSSSRELTTHSFRFKTVFIPKRKLLRVDYVTKGAWSARRQKRHRVWINGNFLADGTDIRQYLEREYPGWTLRSLRPQQGIYVLRKGAE